MPKRRPNKPAKANGFLLFSRKLAQDHGQALKELDLEWADMEWSRMPEEEKERWKQEAKAANAEVKATSRPLVPPLHRALPQASTASEVVGMCSERGLWTYDAGRAEEARAFARRGAVDREALLSTIGWDFVNEGTLDHAVLKGLHCRTYPGVRSSTFGDEAGAWEAVYVPSEICLFTFSLRGGLLSEQSFLVAVGDLSDPKVHEEDGTFEELMRVGSEAGRGYVKEAQGQRFFHRREHVDVPETARRLRDFLAPKEGRKGSGLLDEVFVCRSEWNAVLGSLRWLTWAAARTLPDGPPWALEQPPPNIKALEDLSALPLLLGSLRWLTWAAARTLPDGPPWALEQPPPNVKALEDLVSAVRAVGRGCETGWEADMSTQVPLGLRDFQLLCDFHRSAHMAAERPEATPETRLTATLPCARHETHCVMKRLTAMVGDWLSKAEVDPVDVGAAASHSPPPPARASPHGSAQRHPPPSHHQPHKGPAHQPPQRANFSGPPLAMPQRQPTHQPLQRQPAIQPPAAQSFQCPVEPRQAPPPVFQPQPQPPVNGPQLSGLPVHLHMEPGAATSVMAVEAEPLSRLVPSGEAGRAVLLVALFVTREDAYLIQFSLQRGVVQQRHFVAGREEAGVVGSVVWEAPAVLTATPSEAAGLLERLGLGAVADRLAGFADLVAAVQGVEPSSVARLMVQVQDWDLCGTLPHEHPLACARVLGLASLRAANAAVLHPMPPAVSVHTQTTLTLQPRQPIDSLLPPPSPSSELDFGASAVSPQAVLPAAPVQRHPLAAASAPPRMSAGGGAVGGRRVAAAAAAVAGEQSPSSSETSVPGGLVALPTVPLFSDDEDAPAPSLASDNVSLLGMGRGQQSRHRHHRRRK